MKSLQRSYSKGFLYGFIIALCSVWANTNAAPEMKQFVLTTDMASGERISASQINAAKDNSTNSIEVIHGVSMVEEFRSSNVWIQAFNAEEKSDVEAYLAKLAIESTSLIESSFIHTPESVGGPKAGDVRDGHNVYMIEREVPGAGDLPQEMRDKIALGSQATIEKIGDDIEWDHSYVTSEGTFCVYRATDPSLIKKHAQMFEVPANLITQVEHVTHDFKFDKNL